MNRKKHRLLPAIAPMLLALSFLTSGCVEPLDPSLRGSTDPNAVSLPIRLYIPNAMPATKAGAGDVSGVSPESQVYRVQVWMFDHQAATETAGDGEKAVAYAEADLSTSNTQNMGPYDQSGYYATWESAKIFRLPLMIPGYVLEREAAKMKFDFYVLANAASIGSTAGRETTRGALKALTFGKTTSADYFGTTAGSVKTGATPSNALGTSGPGLPISGFFNKTRNDDGTTGDATGVDLSFLKPETLKTLTPAQITAKSPVVQLERAVSKIRFVFAAPTGMTGMSITGIEVNGSLIPDNTYVFPRESDVTLFQLPSASMTYGGVTAVTPPASVGTIVDPNYLRSTCDSTFTIGSTTYKKPKEMTAQEYEDFLTAAVSASPAALATETYVYLRESDKPITGKIKYKLSTADDAPEYTATFDMTKVSGYSAVNTNFHRNHSWIVYAYFQGGALYIKPVVLPWEDGGSYSFTTPGTAFVSLSNNPLALFGYGWTTSTENTWYTAGKPTEWYFRRQNPENGDLTDPDYWKNDWVHSQMVVAPGLNLANAPIFANRIELTTLGFSERLILKLSDPEHFELVIYHSDSADYEVVNDPNGAVIPAAVTTEGITYFYVVPKDGSDNLNLSVSAYLITENSGQMIPFNANAFPGSNENTGIYFYSVSQDTFKGYYNTLPENVKAYDKDGEITI